MTLIVRQVAAEDARQMTAQLRATRPRIANQFAAHLPPARTVPPPRVRVPAVVGRGPELAVHDDAEVPSGGIVFRPLSDGVDVFRVLEGNRDLAALLADL